MYIDIYIYINKYIYIYIYILFCFWIVVGVLVHFPFFTNRLTKKNEVTILTVCPVFGDHPPVHLCFQCVEIWQKRANHCSSSLHNLLVKHICLGGMVPSVPILLLKSTGLSAHGPGKGFGRSGNDPQVLIQGKVNRWVILRWCVNLSCGWVTLLSSLSSPFVFISRSWFPAMWLDTLAPNNR